MNYERCYTNLILQNKARGWTKKTAPCYTETHHWYPKALYPQWANCDWNKVELTAREHFIAHHLLHRMLGGKMTPAFWNMCTVNKTGERYIPPSTAYAEARRAFSERMSGRVHSPETRAKMSAATSGENNPMYGKPRSPETRAKISAANSGENNFRYGKSLSPEHRAKIGAAHSGKNSPHFGTLPWNNAKAQNPKSQHLWSLLEQTYEWWLKNNHKKYGSGGIAAAKYFGFKVSCKTWHNMILYCRKFPNGSWYESDDYKDWQMKFKKELICDP